MIKYVSKGTMFKIQETEFYVLGDNAILELEGGKFTPCSIGQNVSREVYLALCFAT